MRRTTQPPTEPGFYIVFCDNEPRMMFVEFTGEVYSVVGMIGLDLEQVTNIFDIYFWTGPHNPEPPTEEELRNDG